PRPGPPPLAARPGLNVRPGANAPLENASLPDPTLPRRQSLGDAGGVPAFRSGGRRPLGNPLGDGDDGTATAKPSLARNLRTVDVLLTEDQIQERVRALGRQI